MGWLKRKPDAVCHFCQSRLTLLSPDLKGKAREPALAFGWRNSPNAFLCAVCDSWNTTDNDGRLTSSPPAWIDPRLGYEPFNQSAAAARAGFSLSPSSSATFASSPFCRTCQSNQSLQTHLLASFPLHLPSDLDPPDHVPNGSPPLSLDEYRHSLDLRYPLLCAECAPAVESVIKAHDYKAKAWAFGHRLTKSVSGPVTGQGAGGGLVREGEWRWWAEGVAWRVRGVAWALTQAAGVAASAAAAVDPLRFSQLHNPTRSRYSPGPWLVPLAVLSLFWSFWDPTWDRARQARVRGRRLDVHRRMVFIALQWITYLARLAIAGLERGWWAIENAQVVRWAAFASSVVLLTIALVSPSIIQLRPPPRVRLTSSRRIEPPSERPPSPSELLSTVSLSSSPSSNLRSRKTRPHPIFGQASIPTPNLTPPSSAPQPEIALLPESMDWEPLQQPPAKPTSAPWWSTAHTGSGGVQLAKQRFPTEPVKLGLEDELMNGMVLDDRMDEGEAEGGAKGEQRRSASWWMDWLS